MGPVPVQISEIFGLVNCIQFEWSAAKFLLNALQNTHEYGVQISERFGLKGFGLVRVHCKLKCTYYIS